MQCTDESSGRPRSGCSAFKVLKQQFDDSYNGNRAPAQILIHTPYLQHKCAWGCVGSLLLLGTPGQRVGGWEAMQPYLQRPFLGSDLVVLAGRMLDGRTNGFGCVTRTQHRLRGAYSRPEQPAPRANLASPLPPSAPARRQYRDDVAKFLRYAMAKPGVWAVTMSQLLDWMEAPVPAAAVSAYPQSDRPG